MTPVFVTLTREGARTAERAAAATGGEVHAPENVGAHLRALFTAGRPIVGVCAAGILIRVLAPLLSDKREEPPVIALSEDGASIVPLLGGHRGANALARRLAEALGGHAAVTTAGDGRFGVALDAPPPGWTLANPAGAKSVIAALLAGTAARLDGDARWLAESGIPFAEDGAVHLVATVRESSLYREDAHHTAGAAVTSAARGGRRSQGEAASTPGRGDERSMRRTLAETAPARSRGRSAAPGSLPVDHGRRSARPLTLVYHPRRLALGIGCERDADPEEAADLALRTLAEAGLAKEAVALVASIDLKADEPAVLQTAARLGVPARFFTAAALEAETPRLAHPSDAVFREVGTHGVAEAAALAAAGPQGSLVVAKRKSRRVTCAIAEATEVIDPRAVGRARGRLAIVGIGPGSADWLTPEARRLLEECDAAVGYGLYLDLVAPLIAHAERFESALGAEEARVTRALELAGAGRSVALVSSGDAGIYALATLVFECLDAMQPRRPEVSAVRHATSTCPARGRSGASASFSDGEKVVAERPDEGSQPGAIARNDGRSTPSPVGFADTLSPWETIKRIEIVVAPGVSAMQAAAARAGAPLGHDFCAISLSDLLTPWEAIEARIRAAAEADFVVAFYNPVSQRRRTQLARAKAILLGHRPPDTPVILGRNLGREGEAVSTVTLASLEVDRVDMLTIVIVGASTTRQVRAGGGIFTYTPRGYATKRRGDAAE